ncbi:transposase [Halorientalis sp. IM1011]|uniref:RNA-guided endonuclease InsQ/TnpB family protein n=1 Tax=Halorientalis sp. IM1011 TaxID=1932360 RepID=UPI00097CD67A|nr:RNA-guided endonuclease TnpB family protein [Halorientalis sp. IM1011]AQL42583.1 transposase [Halorientalis sp. IM1011]
MADDYVYRTAITRLEVSDEQRVRLEETIAEWKRGCQIATNLAWNRCHEKSDVQSLAYDTLRERTDLGSQHAILATHQAAQAITGCIERRSRGEQTSKPRFTAPTVKYDSRTLTLFDDETVSLSTTESRIRCPLVLPEDDDGFQWQFLDSERWEVTESTLTADGDDYFLHLGFRRPKTDAQRTTAENGTVLGVDLGVENIAVTSTARFFPGGELNHTLSEFEEARAGLQRTGTRSAHRTIEQASGRQLRRVRDEMHRVSKGIVTEAVRYDCDRIVFEDLTHIRKRTEGAWGHRWAFRQLYQFVEYKAERHGIEVTQVGSAYTSKRCAECGFTSDENRPTREHFECQSCGTEANADYNAAKTVGMRYVRRGQQSSRRTGDGQLALKSGTVTPNGGFTAYPDGFEAEFTDKPQYATAPPSDPV